MSPALPPLSRLLFPFPLYSSTPRSPSGTPPPSSLLFSLPSSASTTHAHLFSSDIVFTHPMLSVDADSVDPLSDTHNHNHAHAVIDPLDALDPLDLDYGARRMSSSAASGISCASAHSGMTNTTAATSASAYSSASGNNNNSSGSSGSNSNGEDTAKGSSNVNGNGNKASSSGNSGLKRAPSPGVPDEYNDFDYPQTHGGSEYDTYREREDEDAHAHAPMAMAMRDGSPRAKRARPTLSLEPSAPPDSAGERVQLPPLFSALDEAPSSAPPTSHGHGHGFGMPGGFAHSQTYAPQGVQPPLFGQHQSHHATPNQKQPFAFSVPSPAMSAAA
ncbi:hypothetical protein EW145_g8552, partial [Phellinidium pouzarii]